MDSLVGYGSDDDNEMERHHGISSSGPSGVQGGSRRRDDDTNYDDVNMDMSEDSQAESEPELPPADAPPSKYSRYDRRGSADSRERRDRRRDSPQKSRDRDRESPLKSRDRDRDSPPKSRDRDRHADRRSPRRDDKHIRSEKTQRGRGNSDSSSSRKGLLGDRPDDRLAEVKTPALMDIKTFAPEGSVAASYSAKAHGSDARDAVSPRFVDRGDRRERDRERERDRDRHSRRSEERRSGSSRHGEHRSRSRGPAYPPPAAHASSSNERRGSPPQSGDYRPSSYKVNKKLEVMEKMGLQIKTPDGSMATAQQLRAAACEPGAPRAVPSYYNAANVNANKILDQVNKRKLLWSNKNKSEAEEAAKWSGTRFAQDNDGKQVSKFMRLMGIKDQAAMKAEPEAPSADPIKKQEELFQAMQAQYEVARATTHTMRGVGLGFQRGQY